MTIGEKARAEAHSKRRCRAKARRYKGGSKSKEKQIPHPHSRKNRATGFGMTVVEKARAEAAWNIEDGGVKPPLQGRAALQKNWRRRREIPRFARDDTVRGEESGGKPPHSKRRCRAKARRYRVQRRIGERAGQAPPLQTKNASGFFFDEGYAVSRLMRGVRGAWQRLFSGCAWRFPLNEISRVRLPARMPGR